MIVKEIVTYGGVEFYKTYSDIGMKIERDGVLYNSATDPIDTDRTYIETDVPAKGSANGQLSDTDALNIIMGVSQ